MGRRSTEDNPGTNDEDVPKNFKVLFIRRHEKRMKETYKKFRAFCNANSCLEVIVFLEELADIQFESFVSPAIEIDKRCNRLYNQAFHIEKFKGKIEGVTSNINVRYELREKVRSLVHASNKRNKSKKRLLVPGDFVDIRDNLFHLCENDIYLRFQTSLIEN